MGSDVNTKLLSQIYGNYSCKVDICTKPEATFCLCEDSSQRNINLLTNVYC